MNIRIKEANKETKKFDSFYLDEQNEIKKQDLLLDTYGTET